MMKTKFAVFLTSQLVLNFEQMDYWTEIRQEKKLLGKKDILTHQQILL